VKISLPYISKETYFFLKKVYQNFKILIYPPSTKKERHLPQR